MPRTGPDSRSLLRRGRRAGFFFAATFFLLGAFLAAGFFFATRFLLRAFFLPTFFLVSFFFLLIFLFFAAGFFRETFFRLAAFLVDVLLATTLFFDDFFADDFFLLTFRFFAGALFRLTALDGAAFFLVARVVFRFLLAVFLAVISKFLPNRKARNYTPVVCTWKGIYEGFSKDFACRSGASLEGFSESIFKVPVHAGTGCSQGRLRGGRTVLEAASTAALSQIGLSPTTIVLLPELHYTSPNFQAMGT